MMMACTRSGSTLSLTDVGKPAPPRPTQPHWRTASTKLSLSVTTGGLIPSHTACCPSVSMTTTVSNRPLELTISSRRFTFPDTPE